MIIILIVSISSIEMGLNWIKKYKAVKRNVSIDQAPSWSRWLATLGVWAGFVSDVVGTVVLIAILIIAAFVLSGATGFDFNSNFFTLMAILTVYFLSRSTIKKVFKPVLEKLNESSRKGLATYEISKDGVTLILSGWPENKRRLFVRYDELSDIRVLDRYESMALQQYGIGPDVVLGLKASRDIVAYNMGKIERPKKFSYLANVSGAKTLLLHGPEILYLVGIQDPTGEDLLKAFEKASTHHPTSSPTK
jgi:hypothetical protein